MFAIRLSVIPLQSNEGSMSDAQIQQQLDKDQRKEDLQTISGNWLWAVVAGAVAILGRSFFLWWWGDVSHPAPPGQGCIAELWALAWLGFGFVLGFLFGIPKVLQSNGGSTSDTGSSDSPRLKVNTNLEEISDWLTKILVGATLTQLVKIPSAIHTCATFMAVGDSSYSAVSFAAAVLLYFAVIGFLGGYLLTRTYFAQVFDRADRIGSARLGEITQTLQATKIEVGHATEPNQQTLLAARQSTQVKLTNELTAEQAEALAKGANLVAAPDRALRAATIAVEKSPDDPSPRLTQATAFYQLGNKPEAIRSLLEAAERTTAITPMSMLQSIYNSLIYTALYLPPPASFEQAIRAWEEFKEKGGEPTGLLMLNLACAYGQKFASLLDQRAPDGELEQSREAAYDTVKQALRLDPSTAGKLTEVLWVTGNKEDNDLSCFQQDKDFIQLLPKPKRP
jgi:tetratricopeptide (TPR) repeat protein